MKQNLVTLLAVLGAALPLSGNVLADERHHHNASHQKETVDVNHSNHSAGDAHDHGTLMISEGQPVPDIDLMVYKDPINGWNLEVKLNNFALTPENVNQANQPNKGHAHLYVNGEKVSRIYSNWYHLPSLPSGSNEIRVALNSNSHQSLMYQGKMIEDTEIVTVP